MLTPNARPSRRAALMSGFGAAAAATLSIPRVLGQARVKEISLVAGKSRDSLVGGRHDGTDVWAFNE